MTSINRIVSAACVLIAALCLASCKEKDEKVDLLPSLQGKLRFDAPKYTTVGQTLTFVPSKMTTEDGGPCGYAWTVAPFSTKRDTTRRQDAPASVTGSFSFTVPDTICTITFSCTAFAEGHYSTNVSAEVEVVDKDKSLTNIDYPQTVFTDGRDGSEYPYCKIGNLEWFSKNLAYGDCQVLDDTEQLKPIYGGYYDWQSAIVSCPEGWRLPAEADWKDLAEALGAKQGKDESYLGVAGDLLANGYFNGRKLWDYWPNMKITNSSGFAALPLGYCVKSEDGNKFLNFSSYSVYWTADEAAEDQAYYRYIYMADPDIRKGRADKELFCAAVRCVRDADSGEEI